MEDVYSFYLDLLTNMTFRDNLQDLSPCQRTLLKSGAKIVSLFDKEAKKVFKYEINIKKDNAFVYSDRPVRHLEYKLVNTDG